MSALTREEADHGLLEPEWKECQEGGDGGHRAVSRGQRPQRPLPQAALQVCLEEWHEREHLGGGWKTSGRGKGRSRVMEWMHGWVRKVDSQGGGGAKQGSGCWAGRASDKLRGQALSCACNRP